MFKKLANKAKRIYGLLLGVILSAVVAAPLHAQGIYLPTLHGNDGIVEAAWVCDEVTITETQVILNASGALFRLVRLSDNQVVAGPQASKTFSKPGPGEYQGQASDNGNDWSNANCKFVIVQSDTPLECPEDGVKLDFTEENMVFDVLNVGPITIVITARNDDDEPTAFEWYSSRDVEAIYVKAGQDTGSTVPDEPREGTGQSPNGKGISHISWCWGDEEPTGTPTPTDEPTEEPTETSTPTDEPTEEPTPTETPQPNVPEFPVCEEQKVLEFGPDSLRMPDKLHANFKFNVPAGYDSGTVEVYAGLGHNWDNGCTEGDGNDPGRTGAPFHCDQSAQLNEAFHVSVNSTVVGTTVDEGTDLNVFFSFPISNLVEGENELDLNHVNQGATANSVFFKGVICVNPSGTPTPTDEPTEEPTETSTPTDEPTEEPTPSETPSPTDEPTEEPTPSETPSPTDEPTEEPTPSETPSPTDEPTEEPTPSETPSPTDEPTEEPTTTPGPTKTPTEQPTETPTDEPTETPTTEPTTTPKPTPVCKEDCEVRFPFMSTGWWEPEVLCSILIWDDPRYKRCVAEMSDHDWNAGIFRSLFDRNPDGEYKIELEDPSGSGDEAELHAYAAGLITGDQELVLRFQQFRFEDDDQERETFVFHNGLYWTGDSTLVLSDIGSYEVKERNDAPFQLSVYGQDAQTITWSEIQVGQAITLTDETVIMPGYFNDDYRNSNTAAFGIRRGCHEVIVLKEYTGFRIVPHTAKIMVEPIPGCRLKEAPTGFLVPLLAGEDTPADPNQYKRSGGYLEDEAAAAQSLPEVNFVLGPIED